MPSTCEFLLNNPSGIYYSGQEVSGSIVLNTTSQKDVRGIRLRFLGESKVSWNETESRKTSGDREENYTVEYRANEVYIDNSTLVQGSGILPAGTHTYTFNIPLPISCPTSCEGKYGHTRYALWLLVERPSSYDNVFSKQLTVLRTVDLNLNPEYRVPLHVEETTSLCCWPCSSGSIRCTLRVPFGAYAPGQTLRYSLLIQNQSMTDVTGYKVDFNEHIKFSAQTPRHKTRSTDTVLASQEHSDDTCLRLTNRQFDGDLILPALPPDTEGNCIIRVTHSLHTEILFGGCHCDQLLEVPIYIGTVPIRESLENNNHFTPVMPSAPLLADGENSDSPPSYGYFKPPSFEEAIRSASPFKDPDGNKHTTDSGFRP